MVLEGMKSSFNDLTGSVISSVTNPLNAARESMSKTISGQRLDLIDQSYDSLQAQELQNTFLNNRSRFCITVEKKGISSKKVAVMKTVFEGFNVEGNFEQSSSTIKTVLKSIGDLFNQGLYLSKYEGGVVENKKSTLNTKEKPVAVTEFSDFERNLLGYIDHSKHGLYTTLFPEFTKVFDHKGVLSTHKTSLRQAQEDALDHAVTLASTWKNYISLLRVIQKHTGDIRKLQDLKAAAFGPEKKKFDDEIEKISSSIRFLLDNEGNGLLSKISDLEGFIQDAYKKANDSLSRYSATFSDRQKGATDSIGKGIISIKKNKEVVGKDLLKSKKSLEGIKVKKNKIHDTLMGYLKMPFDKVEDFNATITSLHDLHNEEQQLLTSNAKSVIKQREYILALFPYYSTYIDAYQNHLYDSSVLVRLQQIFLGLINRYHKRHVSLAKDSWNKLLDLKRFDPSLFGTYVEKMQEKAEQYNGIIRNNEIGVRTHKNSLSVQKKAQRQTVRILPYIDDFRSYITKKSNSRAINHHRSYLESLVASNKSLIRDLTGKEDDIVKAEKRTLNILEDKEMTYNVKPSKDGKVEIEKLHKQHDNQQMMTNAYTHFIEETTVQSKELKTLADLYKGSGKELEKQLKTTKKQLATSQKNIGKSELLHDMGRDSTLLESSTSDS